MKKLKSHNEDVQGIIDSLEEWEASSLPICQNFIDFYNDPKYEIVRDVYRPDMNEMTYPFREAADIEDPGDFLDDLDEMMEDAERDGEEFEIEEGLYDEIAAIVDKFSDIYEEADDAYHLI